MFPLHEVIEKRDWYNVREELEKGHHINVPRSKKKRRVLFSQTAAGDGHTPLSLAIKLGIVDMVKQIVKVADGAIAFPSEQYNALHLYDNYKNQSNVSRLALADNENLAKILWSNILISYLLQAKMANFPLILRNQTLLYTRHYIQLDWNIVEIVEGHLCALLINFSHFLVSKSMGETNVFKS